MRRHLTVMERLPDGYRAVVIGATGGIGSAVMRRLRDDPRCGEAIGLGRSTDGIDVTDEATLAEAAQRVGGEVHLLFIATGALEIDGNGPEKAFKHVEPEAMARQFALNATGPALVIKHFKPLIARREPTAVAALSARVGSIGDNGFGGWMGYRASKAALNQLIRCAAIELWRTHKKCVVAALHPGTVRTELTEGRRGDYDTLSPDESAERLLSVLDSLRPEATGTFRDWQGEVVEW